MKILFAAPVTYDRYTFFISQYATGLARAAKTLDVECRLVQTTEGMYNPLVWGFLEKAFAGFRNRHKWIADYPHDFLLSNQIYREVRDYKPDILFLHLVDTYYVPSIINRIQNLGTKVVVWLGIHPSQVSSGIHDLVKSSDITLIYDSSYTDYYERELHMSNLEILSLGYDVDYADSIVPDPEFIDKHGVDVCFVGIIDKHREQYLNALSDFDLGIWSWNLSELNTPLKKFHRGVAYGDELIKIIKSSKIVLNIHREFEQKGGNYRLFEIPACGAFQLVDKKPDIDNYYKVGSEIDTFNDIDELQKKVKYYLRSHKKRQTIAKAGYERTKTDHQLTQRMERFLEIVNRSKG